MTYAKVALLVCVVVTLFSCTNKRAIEQVHDNSNGALFINIPDSAQRVQHSAIQLLANKELLDGTPFASMSAHAATDPLFPVDYQLRSAARLDPTLASYAELPLGQRTNDVFLSDPLSRYWYSEYQVNGTAASFHSEFIVHISPQSGGSEVSVLELHPTVNAGTHFVLFGHHGPGKYSDLQDVAPTRRERVKLLQLILAQWQKDHAR